MKRKDKSQVQSEAKRKWDAQKEVSKNWPPFPLKADCAYSGSKDPERISCAFHALNWLIDVAFHEEETERGAKGLWYSELYQEQYMEALEEASDTNMTWTGWGIKLPAVPVANNTTKLGKEDFFSLRQWFQIVCQLVSTDLQAHEKQATANVEKDIQQSKPEEEAKQGVPNSKLGRPPTVDPKDAPVRDLVFISYSHKDKRWFDDLLIHLKPLVRSRSITAWCDEQIEPGSKWFSEIKAALASTKVAVLLVTPNFLASDFIHEHELTPLLKAADKGNVRIIWIPVRACLYKQTPLKDDQAAIDPAKPLAKMKKADRDEAWVGICEKIKKAVGGISFKLKIPNRSTLRTIEQLKSGKGVTFDSVDKLVEDLDD